MLDKSIRETDRDRQGLQTQEKKLVVEIKKIAKHGRMEDPMKGVTKAMGPMNRQMNLPSLQRIMQCFERQNEMMVLTGEVMGDAIDDALGGDEELEETDELVNQVLDEIGINVDQELVNAPSAAVVTPAAENDVAQTEAAGNGDGGIDEDLQASLDNLRIM